jgi:hypothetical protein
MARIKAMRRGIVIQDRMAFAGEFFGREAATSGWRGHRRDPRRELQSLASRSTGCEGGTVGGNSSRRRGTDCRATTPCGSVGSAAASAMKSE